MTRYILFASFSQFYKFKLIRQLSQLANEFKFVSCLTSYKAQYVFRLDALALSVIATATWLAVCHSRYCIKTTKRI